MPLANFELKPFRDAGNGLFDHGLGLQVSRHRFGWPRDPADVQDILYGMHKALVYKLCQLETFNPRDYQYYETPVCVDQQLREQS